MFSIAIIYICDRNKKKKSLYSLTLRKKLQFWGHLQKLLADSQYLVASLQCHQINVLKNGKRGIIKTKLSIF